MERRTTVSQPFDLTYDLPSSGDLERLEPRAVARPLVVEREAGAGVADLSRTERAPKLRDDVEGGRPLGLVDEEHALLATPDRIKRELPGDQNMERELLRALWREAGSLIQRGTVVELDALCNTTLATSKATVPPTVAMEFAASRSSGS